jgi:hypothetical protein
MIAMSTGALGADSRAKTQPPAPHAAIGPISWDTVPAKVRPKGGGFVAFRKATWESERSPEKLELVFRRAGDALDVLVTQNGVMLHREPGILDVALDDKSATFLDAAPDGKNIWISSLNKGIFLIDPSGKSLGKIDQGGGLPASQTPMQITAIAPGLLVALGSRKSAQDPALMESWVAGVSYDAKSASPIQVGIIASGDKLPDGWQAHGGAGKWRFEAVRMIPFASVSDPDEDSRAWVLVKGPLAAKFSSVEINARTLEAKLRAPSAASAGPAEPEGLAPVPGVVGHGVGESSSPSRKTASADSEWMPFALERDAVCRSENGALYSIIYHRIYAIPVGQTGIAVSRFKRLADIPAERGGDFLPLGDLFYIAGERWYRFDPKSLKVNDVGPGLQIAGVAVENGVSYAISAHYGLCAFSASEGCFHPFSLDPAKPLHEHPTSQGVPGMRYAPPIIPQ